MVIVHFSEFLEKLNLLKLAVGKVVICIIFLYQSYHMKMIENVIISSLIL